MLDAVLQALGFIAGRTRDDLERDPMRVRAPTHAVMEIGEAAARTSDAGRARAPSVPWGQIVAMRHILVHVYWGVNRDRLWATATDDLPVLIAELKLATARWPLVGEGPAPRAHGTD
jgi:uncharacterized protein with HEPN domain